MKMGKGVLPDSSVMMPATGLKSNLFCLSVFSALASPPPALSCGITKLS